MERETTLEPATFRLEALHPAAPADEILLGELAPFPMNPSERPQCTIPTVTESLQTYGAAPSIVIADEGTALAGNGLAEAAAQVGMENVRVIPVDGTEIIAVQVSHLPDE